jgi:hypothetical protein
MAASICWPPWQDRNETRADEGVIAAEDRELYWYCETAEDIWRTILEWHEANGTSLL